MHGIFYASLTCASNPSTTYTATTGTSNTYHRDSPLVVNYPKRNPFSMQERREPWHASPEQTRAIQESLYTKMDEDEQLRNALIQEYKKQIDTEKQFNQQIIPLLFKTFGGSNNNDSDDVYNRLTLHNLSLPPPYDQKLKDIIYRLQSISFDKDGKYLPYALHPQQTVEHIIVTLRSSRVSDDIIRDVCIQCNVADYEQYVNRSFLERAEQTYDNIPTTIAEFFCNKEVRSELIRNHPYNKNLIQVIELCRQGNFAEANAIVHSMNDVYVSALYNTMHGPFLATHLPAYSPPPEQNNNPQEPLQKPLYDNPALSAYHNQRITLRSHAMDDITRQGEIITTQLCHVSEAAQKSLHMSNIAHQKFEICTGHQLQQAIHADCVAMLNAFATYDITPPLHYSSKLFLRAIDMGRELNQEGALDEAISMTDACWHYCKAFGEGLYLGAENAVNIIIHPLDTIGNAVSTLQTVGNFTTRIGKGIIQAACNPEQAAYDLYEFDKKLQAQLHVIKDHMLAMSGPDRLRLGVMLATDVFLSRKVWLGIHKLKTITKESKYVQQMCKNARSKVIQLKEAAKNMVRAEKVATITSEGINIPASTSFFDLPNSPKDVVCLPNVNTDKLQQAIAYATTENSLTHFFKNNKHEHGFDEILEKIGGIQNINIQRQFTQDVVKQLMQSDKLPMAGVFKGITVNVAGNLVECKGCIHDGILKMSTMFIRSKFKKK